MTTLSSHVLDTERGVPASGVSITLYRDDQQIAQVQTDTDGRVRDVAGHNLATGIYRLVFDVAGYLETQGRPAPFLRSVTMTFTVNDADPHYHVPLLMTPYACTSYRGS
ncbi:MAG: hydroxyisourate hydrolase [Chloroflexota bacterium]